MNLNTTMFWRKLNINQALNSEYFVEYWVSNNGIGLQWVNHFADNNFKCIFLIENVCILNQIWLNFKSPLVQVIACCWTGDKLLSKLMLALITEAYMLFGCGICWSVVTWSFPINLNKSLSLYSDKQQFWNIPFWDNLIIMKNSQFSAIRSLLGWHYIIWPDVWNTSMFSNS